MACRIEHLIRTVLAVVLSGLMAACGQAASEPSAEERLRAAFARGDGFGAELVLRERLADGTPRVELAAAMGEAELMQGELAEARRWLAPGKFSPETRGHGFRQLGRLEMREGNLPAAGAAFDQAYQTIPDDSNLWVDIGRLRLDRETLPRCAFAGSWCAMRTGCAPHCRGSRRRWKPIPMMSACCWITQRR